METKPTKQKLRALIKNKHLGAEIYRKMGFKGIAKDEKRHAKCLEKALMGYK